MNSEETYRIVTVCFDHEGNELAPMGVAPFFDTGCAFPTFGIVKPAVTNTRVDMSPYGQSVFADAVDAVQAVDLTFDALINEVDVSKMRVFLSDVLFDREKSGDKAISIPFGKQDCTVFRKVMSTEDTIQEFAPALRTSSQSEAFRIALQMLGDLTGFGIGYFDFDESHGYVRTATEVSSDNSALMRNIRRHENALQGPIVAIARAVMAVSRGVRRGHPRRGRHERHVRRLDHPGRGGREGAGHGRGGRHHERLGVSRQVVRRGREDGQGTSVGAGQERHGC